MDDSTQTRQLNTLGTLAAYKWWDANQEIVMLSLAQSVGGDPAVLDPRGAYAISREYTEWRDKLFTAILTIVPEPYHHYISQFEIMATYINWTAAQRTKDDGHTLSSKILS